jgi:pre-60S factor REI1
MKSRHGLHIPDEEELLVDVEALLRYMHLVIHDYHECLDCHTTRASSHAIQQHMLSQGHCQVDFDAEDSEFREFYKFELSDADSESEDDSDDDEEVEREEHHVQHPTQESTAPLAIGMSTEETLRLPSGKILQNRKAGGRKAGHRRRVSPARSLEEHAESDPPTGRLAEDTAHMASNAPASNITDLQLSTTNTSSSLRKQERRKREFTVQMANMRASDQRALAHLPLPERRALMAVALKQEAKADQEQQRFRAKMDGIGNVSAKERFVNDVPGGKAHRNRFFAR